MANRELEKWNNQRQALLSTIDAVLKNARDIMARQAAEIHRLQLSGGFPDPTESGGRIDVPYVSQHGEGADKRDSDCGPAALTSVIHGFTNRRPTVNEVGDACKQPVNGYTTAADLIRGAAVFGVYLDYRRPLTTNDMIQSVLRNRFPAIPLIDYKVLREQTNHVDGVVANQDQRFSAGHWVVFVGFHQDLGVYVHDPNFWGDRVLDGAYRFIPREAWQAALSSAAAGNRYGNQGLLVERVE